jgi:hypothetical protein
LLTFELFGASFFLFKSLLQGTILLAFHLLDLLLLLEDLSLIDILTLLELLQVSIDVLLDLV